MCPPGRLLGSGQQAFFLGLSPPSSCPFILSLPSEKAEKDHAVGETGSVLARGQNRRVSWVSHPAVCALGGSGEAHDTTAKVGREENYHFPSARWCINQR